MTNRRFMLLTLLAACGGSRLFGDRPSVAPQQTIAGEAPATGEDYKNYGKNPWVDAAKDHLSTFAADVDTASYTIARRKLHEGAAAAGRSRCASRSGSTTSSTASRRRRRRPRRSRS